MGARLPPRGGSLHPLAQSRGGGGGDSAWCGCGRGSACRQATYERGDARRGGAGACRGGAGARRGDGWGCGDGHTGGGNNVRRATEEMEARVFHPEVGDYFTLIAFFSRLGLNSLAFVFAGWLSPCPLSRLPRC
jgi:hypothetical protein